MVSQCVQAQSAVMIRALARMITVSSHTESQVSGLDPRIEYILQYFKAMHTVRGDIDSIASSANIDIQYLHHLARTSTDIPHSLVPDLSLIPDEGDFSMPCRNKGPCFFTGIL